MFAEQVGENISYEKILAPVDGFVDAANAFLAQEGAVGCNVTMPFKLDAFNLAKVDDQAAKDAQAVNTLMNGDSGEIWGFNTDGVGLVNDLLNSGVEIKGKRVLLIGAGGAARGVISPLLKAGAASLTIANRTKAKAEEVVNAASNAKVQVVALEDIADVAPHIIINSTAASLSNELPCRLNDGVLVEELKAEEMMIPREVFAHLAKKQPLQEDYDVMEQLSERLDRDGLLTFRHSFLPTYHTGVTKKDQFCKMKQFESGILRKQDSEEQNVLTGIKAVAHLEKRLEEVSRINTYWQEIQSRFWFKAN